jgi:hypothetical protein
VFFRADSLAHAGQMLHGLLIPAQQALLAGSGQPAPWLALILLTGAVLGLSAWAQALEMWCTGLLQRMGRWSACLCLSAVLCGVLYWGPEGVPGFIYYRF